MTLCWACGRGMAMTKHSERQKTRGRERESREKKNENKTLTLSTLTHSPKVNWKYTNVWLHVWALPAAQYPPLAPPLHSQLFAFYSKLRANLFCLHSSSLRLFVSFYAQFQFMRFRAETLHVHPERERGREVFPTHSRSCVDPVSVFCCWQLQFNWVITPSARRCQWQVDGSNARIANAYAIRIIHALYIILYIAYSIYIV